MRQRRKIKVCYIAGREYEYVRTRTVVLALKTAGFDVEMSLPPNKRFRHYPGILWKFFKNKNNCDVVIVGFYGALLLPVVRLLTSRPIIFDIHSGTYETMLDWERVKPGSIMAKIFYWVDKITMNMADRIILESRDHIRNWSKTYGVPEDKFVHVFLATDNTVIYPKPQNKKPDDLFLVHFHGEFAPFHGVEHILRAAHILMDKKIGFHIIGFGTTYERDIKLAKELKLTNCRFIRWVPYEKLADAMCRADVCLGFFGDRKRAYEVFTNKVVEAIAVKRPFITMRNKPVQELLKDGESVILVNPGDPADLANAILMLKNNPQLRQHLSENAYKTFLANCTIEVFARHFKEIIMELLDLENL